LNGVMPGAHVQHRSDEVDGALPTTVRKQCYAAAYSRRKAAAIAERL
jgi:hypothetical protein